MKTTLVITGGVIALLVAGFSYLAIGFAEPDDLRLSSLTTRLFVPPEIRNLPLDENCGVPATVSREWLECGGICGVSYFVRAQVSDERNSVLKQLNDYQARVLQKYEMSISIDTSSPPDTCRAMEIDISHDDRQ